MGNITIAQTNNCFYLKGKGIEMNKLLSICIIWCVSFCAQSHEFLTEIINQQSVTGNTIYTPVTNIQLTQSEILGLQPQKNVVDYYPTRDNKLRAVLHDPDDNCESSGSRTCGQFDHFSLARGAAIFVCYQLGQQLSNLYPNGLVPRFISPSSFVDNDTASQDHHINYSLSEGLNFDCGYFIEDLPNF